MKASPNLLDRLRRLKARILKYRILNLRDLHEVSSSKTLSRIIEHVEPDLVLDIGANEGQFALQIRRSGYTGKLVSVEPNPNLHTFLEQKFSNDASWQLSKVAVSPQAGRAYFNITSNSELSSLERPVSSGSTALDDKLSIMDTVEVDSVTLESLVSEFKNENHQKCFLKIDTQGTDLEIMKSAEGFLQYFDVIVVELSIKNIYKSENSWIEMVSLLQDNGFFLCSLEKNNIGHFPQLLEIDAFFLREQYR